MHLTFVCRHPISGRSLDMLAAGLLERRQELMRGKASTISAVMYSCGRLGRDPVVQVPGRTGASSLVQELLGMVCPDPVAASCAVWGAGHEGNLLLKTLLLRRGLQLAVVQLAWSYRASVPQ